MKARKRKIFIASAFAFVIIAGLVAYLILAIDNSPTYTVSFDSNGGEMSDDEIMVTLDQNYSLPFPTKEGYQFKGWYSDGELFPSMGIWSIKGNVHLKAEWEIRDENGFVYEKTPDGYRVIDYKGIVKERVVVPDRYNNSLVVDVSVSTFVGLKEHLDNGNIKTLLIYIPNRFDASCDGVAFDSRVTVARYEDMDDGGFTYSKGDDGYIVEEYTGPVKDNIIVPKEHKGLPVYFVRKDAWNNLRDKIEKGGSTALVSIFIPDSVENLYYDTAVVGKMRVIKYTGMDDGGVVYLYSQNVMSVVGYIGAYNDSVIVQREYNGYEVTKIGKYAFYGTNYFINQDASSPLNVYLPNTINYVSLDCFTHCDYVKPCLTVGDNVGATPSEVYDWIQQARFEGEMFPLVDVLCNVRAYLSAEMNTRVLCYVRYNLNGGKVFEYLEIGKDSDGNPVYEAVEVFDVPYLTFGLPYKLPVPVREGYIFDGWYYKDEEIPLEGDRWKLPKYLAIDAKWSEIEKEG